MKKATTFFTATLVFIFSMSQLSFAQDDTYYDPNKDPANQVKENNNSQQEPTDRTDGYGNSNENSASRYDETENSESYQRNGDTYITNNYYDDEDYGYTTRLHRYYYPNYGVNYYSYWFTPSFCMGWSSWNTSYIVSYNPWYSDPWWRWNRRNVIIVYDPFYDPYWDWNFGWNSCSYYNSWSNPYGGYSCGYNNWGYNNWGYGSGGGHCGGYGGYNNGYWNGYNNGYYDSYWNSTAYNNGYYNNGYRRHKTDVVETTYTPPVTPPSTNPVKPKTYTALKPREEMEIPKQGIQKPFITDRNIKQQNDGISIQPGTVQPYNPSNPKVVERPVEVKTEEKTNVVKPNLNTNGNVHPVQPNVMGNDNWFMDVEKRNITPKPNTNQNVIIHPVKPDIENNTNWLGNANQKIYDKKPDKPYSPVIPPMKEDKNAYAHEFNSVGPPKNINTSMPDQFKNNFQEKKNVDNRVNGNNNLTSPQLNVSQKAIKPFEGNKIRIGKR